MADFAKWVTAAELALGWNQGDFMAAYVTNRDSANDLAIESSPIGQPLLDYLDEQAGWDGSATELLEVLEEKVPDRVQRQKSWPKNPQSLAGQLKRISPNLRQAGWEVQYYRVASQRIWSIQRLGSTEMQDDANPCKLFPDDTNDTNDTNDTSFQNSQATPEWNGEVVGEDEYDEGFL